jgi:hypothetical protein
MSSNLIISIADNLSQAQEQPASVSQPAFGEMSGLRTGKPHLCS